jgi:hypothetical protein
MGTKPSAKIEWRTASLFNTTITTVTTNLQRVQWTSGRQTISDDWQTGSCVVSGRGFLTSVPAIGDFARVTVTDGASNTIFYGVVADYTRNFGIKSEMDSFDLRLEGASAAFGRVQVTMSWGANAPWLRPISEGAPSLIPIQTLNLSPTVSPETISAYSGTAPYSDTFYPAITTAQAVVKEVGDEESGIPYAVSPVVLVYDRNDPALYQLAATFADDGTGVGYNAIQFLSTSYTYGTRVTVNPISVASQSSGSGIYNQSFTSFDSSTTQALNLAGYIRVSLNEASNVPYSITFEGSSATAASIALSNPKNIKNVVNIKLRGTTYNAVIEGMDFDADPSNWRCTLYLSSSLQNAFLRLNDAVYGKLDTNKLGL